MSIQSDTFKGKIPSHIISHVLHFISICLESNLTINYCNLIGTGDFTSAKVVITQRLTSDSTNQPKGLQVFDKRLAGV